MELTHIKYFLEVARTEHVTQSAKNLCIVQPALTHAIHRLEDELGVKLFKTSGRNIKLTEAGDYFYKKVKPLYEDIEALPARLRAKSDKQAITVSVKVLAASSFVANAIILYKKQSPALRFYLVQKEESSLYDICVQTYSNYRPQENPDEETFVCSENMTENCFGTKNKTVTVFSYNSINKSSRIKISTLRICFFRSSDKRKTKQS